MAGVIIYVMAPCTYSLHSCGSRAPRSVHACNPYRSRLSATPINPRRKLMSERCRFLVKDVGRRLRQHRHCGNSPDYVPTCGQPGLSYERRFPDFSLLSAAGRYTDLISCVIITHFHLDHIGALPYFTE
eukprot:gene1791-33211_t